MEQPKLQVAKCPFCMHGQAFDPLAQAFIPCTECQGAGQVVINHICACGRPVHKRSKDGFLYCGLDTCLTDFRKDREDALKPPSNNFYSRSSGTNYHGPWPNYSE